MKMQLFNGMLIVLLLSPVMLIAQNIKPAEKPYWVVERMEKGSFVYIYDTDHQIIYQEFFKGKKIDPKRKSVKRRLDETVTEFKEQKLLAARFQDKRF